MKHLHTRRYRSNVTFVKRSRPSTPASRATRSTAGETQSVEHRATSTMTGNTLPMCIRQEPPVPYEPATASSDLQQETAEECWPFLLGQEHLEIQEDGLPPLSRRKHHLFLRGALGKLPAGFESLDASRPWMLYWCLEGISLLGEDVSTYQDS